MSFLDKNEIKRLQPFYNVPINKLKIKDLNNLDMLIEFPFYDELNSKSI